MSRYPDPNFYGTGLIVGLIIAVVAVIIFAIKEVLK